mgnify:CR=1 FL=1
MILNIKSKNEYEIYLSQLDNFILEFENSQYYGFDESKFKDAFNKPIVFISDSGDGAEYGIIAGEFYSYNTIKFVNNKLKKQSKELPIWHSSLGDLRHFKSQVASKDFRFINDIDNLPDAIDDEELPPLSPDMKELIDTVIECNKDNEG